CNHGIEVGIYHRYIVVAQICNINASPRGVDRDSKSLPTNTSECHVIYYSIGGCIYYSYRRFSPRDIGHINASPVRTHGQSLREKPDWYSGNDGIGPRVYYRHRIAELVA